MVENHSMSDAQRSFRDELARYFAGYSDTSISDKPFLDILEMADAHFGIASAELLVTALKEGLQHRQRVKSGAEVSLIV